MAFYGRGREDPFRDRDDRGPFRFDDRDRFDRPFRDERRSFDSRGRFDGRGDRRNSDLAAKFRGADDLASKQLQIEAKKFYVDVKENKRGRFFKISEVSSAGQRNRIVFDFTAASDFHEQLTNFIEFFSTCDDKDSMNDKLKSEIIHAGERRYYLDLKANSRGRFLKVALTLPPPSNERQQIVIPAHGMADLRDALTELLSEYGTTATTRKSEKVEIVRKEEKMDEPSESDDHRLSLSADNKKFFFDVISGKDGHCLQISEVTQSFRTQINIPEKAWADFVDKLHTAGATMSGAAHSDDHCDEQELFTDNSDKKQVENWDHKDDGDGDGKLAESADHWSNSQQKPVIGADGDAVESSFADPYQDADYIIC